MTLQGFSFSSAAEVLDDDAGEEGDGVKVGFGFGDGYDLAIVGCTCDLEGVANEAASRIAVEDKSLQLIISAASSSSEGSCRRYFLAKTCRFSLSTE